MTKNRLPKIEKEWNTKWNSRINSRLRPRVCRRKKESGLVWVVINIWISNYYKNNCIQITWFACAKMWADAIVRLMYEIIRALRSTVNLLQIRPSFENIHNSHVLSYYTSYANELIKLRNLNKKSSWSSLSHITTWVKPKRTPSSREFFQQQLQTKRELKKTKQQQIYIPISWSELFLKVYCL